MKTNKLVNIHTFIHIFIIFVLMYPFKAISQFQNPNGANETAVGVSTVNPRCTGNDVFNISGDIFRVSVWDNNGSASDIYWDVFFNSTQYNGTASFAYNVLDPDVALMTDGTDIFALTTYNVPGSPGVYYYEPFLWRQVGMSYAFVSSGATAISSGNHYASVNIDSDGAVLFAITWDTGTPEVMVVTGELSSGAFTLYNSGTPITVSGMAGGYFPDLCMYHDNNYKRVHICYLSTDGGSIIANTHEFNDLTNGSASNTNVLFANATNNFNFNSPRIACPNGSNGDEEDWTVVVEETNNSTPPDNRIVGFNDNSGATLLYYNNASYSPYLNLTSYPNFAPVVTYDDQTTPNVWVGWTFDNTTAGIQGPPEAMYPIVLKCDENAEVPLNTDYWIVPDNLVDDDEVMILSLSARFSNDLLYATYNPIVLNGSSVDDIYTNEIAPSSASSFRTDIPEIYSVDLSSLQFSDELLRFKLFDVSGRLVYDYEGTCQNMMNVVQSNNKFLSSSLYILQVFTINGKPIGNHKLMIQK